MKGTVKTITFYPLSVVFLVGVLFMILVFEDYLELTVALLCYTSATLMIMLLSIQREVRIVHKLVNSQRDELLVRIQDLLDSLHTAGVVVPEKRNDQTTGG